MTLNAFKADNNKVVKMDRKANKTVVNLSKNLILMPNIKAIEEIIFLTPNVRKVFNHLFLLFIKAPIF